MRLVENVLRVVRPLLLLLPIHMLLSAACADVLQVMDQLGLRPTAPRPGAPVQQGAAGRQFILPLADVNCETSINNVLGDLQRDAYPVSSDQRPARCTGTAMQVRRHADGHTMLRQTLL